MAIFIPSKTQKNASQLRDAFRILAWQQYKSENPEIKGLEGYEVFDAEWKAHEIQEMDEKQLMELIKELGYSLAEILRIRTDYYASKNGYPKTEQTNKKSNVIPGDFGSTQQVTDDIAYGENQVADEIPY